MDEEERLKYLHILFQRLNDYGIVINMAKSVFSVAEVLFLDHLVKSDCVCPPPEKVEANEIAANRTARRSYVSFLASLTFTDCAKSQS